MANQVKVIRGQVRQVVKELLPELLGNELIAAIEQQVSKSVHARMDYLSKNVKETLQAIDTRSKDATSYLVRQTTAPEGALKAELPKASEDKGTDKQS